MSSEAPNPPGPEPIWPAPVAPPPPVARAVLPAQPVGYPMPGQQWPVHPNYAVAPAWVHSGRPGIITSIGVFSIIVASLGLIGSFASGGFALVILNVARQASMMATARQASVAAAPVAPPAPVAAGPQMGLRGMEDADRQTVALALTRLEEINPERRRHLIAILALSGQDIFPPKTTPLTQESVRASIRDSGNLPSDDPKDSDPLYFDTPTGHLHLYNDRAVFRPYDPSSPIVRKSAPSEAPADETTAGVTTVAPQPMANPSAQVAKNGKTDPFASDNDPPATTPPAAQAQVPVAPGALSAAQAQSVVQKVQAVASNRLNSAQVASLQAALQAPGQQLVLPGTLWSPVSIAQVQPDGSAVIKFSGGYMFIDAQGQIQDSGTLTPKIAPHRLSLTMVIGEAVLSGALAIFLLISGIVTLRRSTKGRRLHLIYAFVKLPVAIGGGIGFVWMTDSLFANLPRAASSADGFRTFGIIVGVLGVIYPIVLLCVLWTRGVRDYYRNRGDPA